MTTFKTMVGLKRRLGFQTSKEDICLQPSGSEMRTAMEHTVLQMLKEQGWYILEKGHVPQCATPLLCAIMSLLLCHETGFTFWLETYATHDRWYSCF